MEKVKFKVVLGALSFAFFLLVGMNRMEAQTVSTMTAPGGTTTKAGGSSTVLVVPQGNFVSTDDAKTILGDELASLKDQLAQMAPGNSFYTSVLNHYNYYSNIDNALRAGAAVPNAIVQGLSPFTTDEMGVLSQSNLTVLRQAAINLLSI